MKLIRSPILGALLLFFSGVSLPSAHAEIARNQQPDFLTFEELKTLSSDPSPKGALQRKLEKFWVTPLISNEAYISGVKPVEPRDPLLGP